MTKSIMHTEVRLGLVDQLKGKFSRGLGISLFLIMVVVPTLIYGVYVGVFQSSVYQSEFRIQIRSNNDMMLPNFGSMLGLVGSTAHSSSNGYAVVQYLQSADAVRDLDARAGLRQLYTRGDIDFFSRLRYSAVEDVTRYWKSHLNAYYDTTTDTLVVEVSAYHPKAALRLAQTAQKLSEHLLNQMSERSRKDAVAYSQEEVDASEQRMKALETELLKLRNNSQTIDPSKQLGVSLTRISKLQEMVDQAQADLVMRKSYLAPSAPGVQLAESKLRTLQAALAEAQTSVAGRDVPINRSLAGTTYRFEEMEGRKLFAEKRLQAALTGLTTAQADAARQQLYLNTIVSPHLAEEPYAPRPIRDIVIFAAVALGLWLLLTMLLHSVRDHIVG